MPASSHVIAKARLVTAGIDRWSSKTELGLQAQLNLLLQVKTIANRQWFFYIKNCPVQAGQLRFLLMRLFPKQHFKQQP